MITERRALVVTPRRQQDMAIGRQTPAARYGVGLPNAVGPSAVDHQGGVRGTGVSFEVRAAGIATKKLSTSVARALPTP
ncbi:hypothetical protein [Micromonospora fulviviridis]|uniref:Uncharacterized protein n=1 Tax=Micromonospora fulviviridis TaxID=47860 RepID=A0ABV2W086_9ACTN